MSKYNDEIGDEIKAIEDVESSRAASQGDAVVIRLDGASFSNFTKGMDRPYDERMSAAMIKTTQKVVDDFHCRIGYTQSDEMSFILWRPNAELPHGGRLQKLASRFAAKATAFFLIEALQHFPERVEKQVPEFDGRATVFPSIETACKAVLWRELDARKNSVSMAARAHYSAKQLFGKSSREMRDMLHDKGVDFNDYPEFFRRGSFHRRITAERYLTPDELSRIPEKYRPNHPVRRSCVRQVSIPPLFLLENLTDVLIEGAEPVLKERPFAKNVLG